MKPEVILWLQAVGLAGLTVAVLIGAGVFAWHYPIVAPFICTLPLLIWLACSFKSILQAWQDYPRKREDQ